jgi:hypothetical protein
MINFNFSYNSKDYIKRSKSSLTINIFISIVIGLLITLATDKLWGFGIASFFFLVQFYKSDRWDKTFINIVSFHNENVTIEYFNRENQIRLTGHLNEFNFIKEIAVNKIRTPYLAVYQNGQLKLKQFAINDWSESKMDEVIASFKKINLSMTDT